MNVMPLAFARHNAGERRSLPSRLVRFAVANDGELVSAVVALLCGMLLGADASVLSRNPATDGMLRALPAAAWLFVLVGLGAWRLIALVYDHGEARAWGATISAGVWIWVAFLMARTGFSVFAPVVFPMLAVADALTAIRVGRGRAK